MNNTHHTLNYFRKCNNLVAHVLITLDNSSINVYQCKLCDLLSAMGMILISVNVYIINVTIRNIDMQYEIHNYYKRTKKRQGVL